MSRRLYWLLNSIICGGIVWILADKVSFSAGLAAATIIILIRVESQGDK